MGNSIYWKANVYTDPNKLPKLNDFLVTRNISFNYLNIEEAWDQHPEH